MLNTKIILVGYSGHGFVVAEAALLSNIKIEGYLEPKMVYPNHFDLKYLGFEQDPKFDWDNTADFILGIGDNYIRSKLAAFIKSKNKNILNVLHPSASVSKMTQIGTGNFIARNVSINPIVKIGDFCIINTSAIIEHECVIGDGVHVAPGAILAGNVRVGDNTFIGANSVVKQGVSIGSDVVIGAGSVIIRDVESNSRIVGNPGRSL